MYRLLFGWLAAAISGILLVVAHMAPATRQFTEHERFARTLPGPSVIGQMVAALRNKVLEKQGDWMKKYGSVYRIWVGRQLTLVFNNPEDVRSILCSNLLVHKSRDYERLRPWLGNGLLTNGGENWCRKRMLLAPAYNCDILSSFTDAIEEYCDIMIDRLNEVADGRPVDIYKYTSLFALDAIYETATGLKINAQVNEESDYVRAAQLMPHLIHCRNSSAWKSIPCLYKLSTESTKIEEALSVLHDQTRRNMIMRRIQMDNTNGQSASACEYSARRLAFMDILLTTETLSDAEIQEEVNTFLFEGHNTISSAIAFAVFLLAKNPEAQEICYNEILGIEHISFSKPSSFMEAVIKETLRLYPSVPSISRETREPFVIRSIVIPANVELRINTFWVQRHPAHYYNPEDFHPERYIFEAIKPIEPFAHIAFSAGPRSCIGRRFAMHELRSALTRLLMAFEFAAVPDFKLQLQHDLVLRSRNGIQVRLRPRAKID